MIATIAVDTSELVDKYWADSSVAVGMIAANKLAAVTLDIVDNFAAVDMVVADKPAVVVDTALADTTVAADNNSADY